MLQGSQFTEWLEYLGKVYGRIVVGVPPQYTSQNCSNCGQTVKKSLSVRTHVCQCGCVLDREWDSFWRNPAMGGFQASVR